MGTNNSDCVARSLINQNEFGFLGAELYVNSLEAGKNKVILKTYYTFVQSNIAAVEQVYVLDSINSPSYKLIDLRKVNEFIDVNYPMLANNQNGVPPGVKCITYTAELDVTYTTKKYNIVWSYTGALGIINNVDFSDIGALSLLVRVDKQTDFVFNNIPTLKRLPFNKVSTTTTADYIVEIQESGETDLIEISPITPLFFNPASSNKAIGTNKPSDKLPLQQANFRLGFSEALPLGIASFFDKKSSALKINHLAFGKYLMAFSISDKRSGKTLSQHQAVFLIESVNN